MQEVRADAVMMVVQAWNEIGLVGRIATRLSPTPSINTHSSSIFLSLTNQTFRTQTSCGCPSRKDDCRGDSAFIYHQTMPYLHAIISRQHLRGWPIAIDATVHYQFPVLLTTTYGELQFNFLLPSLAVALVQTDCLRIQNQITIADGNHEPQS